jgi:hypothetical protein
MSQDVRLNPYVDILLKYPVDRQHIVEQAGVTECNLVLRRHFVGYGV